METFYVKSTRYEKLGAIVGQHWQEMVLKFCVNIAQMHLKYCTDAAQRIPNCCRMLPPSSESLVLHYSAFSTFFGNLLSFRSTVFRRCFDDVSTVFRRCFDDVSTVFRCCFDVVSTMLRRCFDEMKMRKIKSNIYRAIMLLSFASDKNDVIYKNIYIVEDCYIERVILIINMLAKLLKLEHHRNV